MPDSQEAASIQAHIQGDVSGQIAVGNCIVQVGSVHGGVVNITAPAQQPVSRQRPLPVLLRPRPFPGLLGRARDVAAIDAAIRSAQSVDLQGEPGLGKTALVRQLVHQESTDTFPDGIIYLRVANQAAPDLWQSLYDAFFECETPFKPTDGQFRHAFQTRRALIVLDDVELERDDLERLMDAAPGTVFVMASSQRRVWSEVKRIALAGLDEESALELLEQELGRPIPEPELAQARLLCTALKGHPLRILQQAGLMREERLSFSEVLSRLEGPAPPEESATNHLLESKPDPQLQILQAIAAINGATLHLDALAALTGLAGAGDIAKNLENCRLTQSHSPRFSLTGSLAESVQQTYDLDPWRDRALDYFAGWVQSDSVTRARLNEDLEGILRLLEWADANARSSKVLELGRAIEDQLILKGHWEAWSRVSNWMRNAAVRLGDRASEGYALHQAGTRALGLDDHGAAHSALSAALAIREDIGDTIGAEVTRHNLSLVKRPAPAGPSAPVANGGGISRILRNGGGAILILALLAWLGYRAVSSSRNASKPHNFELAANPNPASSIASTGDTDRSDRNGSGGTSGSSGKDTEKPGQVHNGRQARSAQGADLVSPKANTHPKDSQPRNSFRGDQHSSGPTENKSNKSSGPSTDTDASADRSTHQSVARVNPPSNPVGPPEAAPASPSPAQDAPTAAPINPADQPGVYPQSLTFTRIPNTQRVPQEPGQSNPLPPFVYPSGSVHPNSPAFAYPSNSPGSPGASSGTPELIKFADTISKDRPGNPNPPPVISTDDVPAMDLLNLFPTPQPAFDPEMPPPSILDLPDSPSISRASKDTPEIVTAIVGITVLIALLDGGPPDSHPPDPPPPPPPPCTGTFCEPPSAAVPEGSSASLFISGLAAVIATQLAQRRRRRSSRSAEAHCRRILRRTPE